MSGKLRLYKEKLEGYKKFYQIVKTIKMVTLAKYRQTLARVKTRDQSIRYAEKAFGSFGEGNEQEALSKSTKTMLYFPISTNRGSCGPLNSNMIKYLETVAGNANSKFTCVGKKGNDSVTRLFPSNASPNVFMHDFKVPIAFSYATFLLEGSLAGQKEEPERTQIIFNRYFSPGVQRQTHFNIPAYDKWLEKMNQTASTEEDKANYSFANALVNNDDVIVRDYYDFTSALIMQNAVCENELSEYAARVIAVEGQLTNIAQLQYQTNYLYNKTRQSSITSSLIEIISAMSSLEGNAAKGVNKGDFWASA